VITSLRILLYRPEDPADSIGLANFIRCDPLELASVASLVDPRHEVRIFDGFFDRGLPGELISFRPHIVGTSCYINGVNQVCSFLELVRSIVPDALTVVGGVHATCNPEDFGAAAPDVIVRGEGAVGFAAVVEAFASGGRPGLVGLPGTAWFSGGVCEHAPDRPWPDPDVVPFPRRDLYRRHWPRYYYAFHAPCGLMKTSYGCPYTCSFCYCWKITGGLYRARSPELVVEELGHMWFPEVYLVDDDFFLDAERLTTIRDLLVARNIRKGYFAYGRSDFIAEHPEIIRLWSDIGLKAVVVGVESIHSGELAYYRKHLMEDHNARAFEVLRQARVDVYASFILGPDWTEADFAELREYLIRHQIYYCILQPLMPLPGTDIWEELQDRVILDRDHHELWDISHLCLPGRLPMRRYYREMAKLYIRTTLDPRRIFALRPRTLDNVGWARMARIFLGALRLLWGLQRAPGRYRPAELARYNAGRSLIPATGKWRQE
jgi:hopanoid C-3 methylase